MQGIENLMQEEIKLNEKILNSIKQYPNVKWDVETNFEMTKETLKELKSKDDSDSMKIVAIKEDLNKFLQETLKMNSIDNFILTQHMQKMLQFSRFIYKSQPTQGINILIESMLKLSLCTIDKVTELYETKLQTQHDKHQ